MNIIDELVAGASEISTQCRRTDERMRIARNKRKERDERNGQRSVYPHLEKDELFEPPCRPKDIFFNGVDCVNHRCRSKLPNAPPDHKAYFTELSGHKVCDQCGMVQPGSQVMVQAEERRTFSEDRERGVDRNRTEMVREGETGTGASSVPASLQRASRMASQTDASENVKQRQARYVNCIRKLADEILPFSSVMLKDAVTRAHDLAHAVDEHGTICPDKNCRLHWKPRDGFLFAAALVRMAAADYGQDVKLKDLHGTYLKQVGREYKFVNVSRAYDVVKDLLNGYNANGTYNCMTADVLTLTGAPTKSLLKYTQTVLRVCEALELSTPVRMHAEKVVADWFEAGLGSNTHEVVAGAAVWSVVKDEGGQIKAVAEAAGCASATIKQEFDKHA